MSRIDLLILRNPGASRFPAEDLRAALEKAVPPGTARHDAVLPNDEDRATFASREITRAVEAGCRRVVAIGGDGTVGLIAGAVVRSVPRGLSVSLGIVPAGTANVLARELGIPLGLEEAIAVAVGEGETIAIDAIEAGERFVFTQVGIGPDALMIRSTPREEQERRGRWAYVRAFLRLAFRYRPRRFTMIVDGTEFRARAWQVIAANAGSAASPPFQWGPGIDPTDRTIDLCVYDVRRARDYVVLFWRVLLGRHRRDASTRFFRIHEEATIDSDLPSLVQGDGEILGRTPIRLRVVPEALRVVVAGPVADTVPLADLPRGAGATVERQAAAAAVATEGATVTQDVRTMVATRYSRAWVLQGLLRHPVAALEAFDAALFLRANGMFLGPVFDRVLTTTSRLMHYGEGWALAVLAWMAIDFQEGLLVGLEALPVLWLTMLTVNFPLKKFFRRRRPFTAFVKARVLGPRPSDFSFPSGHSAAAFAGAFLLTSHAPALFPVFYFIATVVGLSRVYLGVHYPSDVVIGAAAGTALAALYRALLHAILALG
ncbi:MAG TPA: phosphatase PAP2 family protein [Candidatus Eisenbacteria bacterium]|nr:phosphatase PAP2 family protein [Candidatus Eisenbacteria bacterium]